MQSRVALALLRTIAFGILRVHFAVLAPIIGIALGPVLLRPRLVILIIWIVLQFIALPTPSAFTLTVFCRTATLQGDLGPRLERFAADYT